MADAGTRSSSLADDMSNVIITAHEEKQDRCSLPAIDTEGSSVDNGSDGEKLKSCVNNDLLKETKMLRDTLDLLWNQTAQQRNLCQELERENEYLQDYISNLMTSSNVLENVSVRWRIKYWSVEDELNLVSCVGFIVVGYSQGMHALAPSSRGDNNLAKKRNTMEPIKLRNLNLAEKHEDALNLKGEKRFGKLKNSLRKPEPAVIQSRHSRRLTIGYSAFKELNDVREEYNAPSPSLGHTLALFPETSTGGARPIRLPDGTILDIAGDAAHGREFDCQPFFRPHNYESRFEKGDCELIISRLVADEMNNKRPVFQKELEFQETYKMLRRIDYIIFYLLGIDRLGYFRLKQERESFQNSLYAAYTSHLRYNDDESSDSEIMTRDEESTSTFHTDDALDDQLSNPSV